MKNFKILAMDLDGTLLNSQAKISDENLMAIKELNKRGIFCVPCSGRTLDEIMISTQLNSCLKILR